MSKTISAAFAVIGAILAAAAPASAGGRTAAEGTFTAVVDFLSLTARTVGANCLLEVDGELTFTGTLEGVADGTTRALVLASCEDALANPPGTFRDVFRSELAFSGTVDGEPMLGGITYRGNTEPGGTIAGSMRLSDGLKGQLKVDAIVAVGGSYRGLVGID